VSKYCEFGFPLSPQTSKDVCSVELQQFWNNREVIFLPCSVGRLLSITIIKMFLIV